MADPRATATLAAVLSAGAGLVHLALAGPHADHHWTMGVAFLVAGIAQLSWALAVWMAGPGRLLVRAGVVLQGVSLLALIATATVGWPLGAQAWQPEAVSTAAVLCACLEVAAALSAGLLLSGRAGLPRVVLPVALAAVLVGSSSAVAFGLSGEHAEAGHAGAGHAAAESTAGGSTAGAGHGVEAHEVEAHPVDAQPVDAHPVEAHPLQAPPHAAPAAGAHPTASAAGHGGHVLETTPATAAQRAAAAALQAASQRTLRRYELASVAEADGYVVVHSADDKLLHYLNRAYATDGRVLDPQRIESLLYVVMPGGSKLLVGGMFTAPKGQSAPRPGGSLTQWHAHDDLCLDPVKGMAFTQAKGGGCPPGSRVGATGEMMHVWSIDYPGGPFAELDGPALRQAVLDVFGVGAAPWARAAS